MDKPKVLMCNPPWWAGKPSVPFVSRWRAGVRAGSRWPFTQLGPSRPNKWVMGDYVPYPFFLGYATTYLSRHSDAEVHFRDSIALRESYRAFYRFVKEGDYDYIFIESSTPSWENDSLIIRKILSLSPRSKIVVCGPICATQAEEILDEHPVHACIKGEYEKGSVKVIEGAGGVIDFDILTQDEMNSAPFPYYDDKHAYRYWDGLPVGQLHPHAQIWSSRGCPFKCIFCVWPATMTGVDPDGAGRRYVRHYSAEYMKAFLDDLTGRFSFRSIYFDDDTFNLGDKHVKAMCEVMRGVGLPWAAMCRTDTIRMETWRLMKESGCFGVKLGFESGNQWVVDNIVRKNLNLEKAAEVVRELKRLGIVVHGTFTYGLPGETQEQMLETRRFIDSLPFDSVQESGAAVIEGTPLATLIKRGNLAKYRGAVGSEDFEVQTDGHKKFESISGKTGVTVARLTGRQARDANSLLARVRHGLYRLIHR